LVIENEREKWRNGCMGESKNRRSYQQTRSKI